MYPTKKLWEICEILDKFRKPVTSSDRKKWIYPYYWATWIQDFVDSYIFDDELVLIWEDWAKWWSWCKTAFKISGKTWVNNHAHVLKAKSDILLDNWLIYFINFSNLELYITWATVKKLNQEKLKQIPIPLPPLPTQQKIVFKLDSLFEKLDRAIALTKQNLVNIEELNKSILEKIFKECEEKYEKRKLGEVCNKITDWSHNPPKWIETWYPMISARNLTDFNEIIFDNLRFLSENDYLLENKRTDVKDWDILLSIVWTIWKVCIVKEKYWKFVMQRSLAVLKLNKNLLNSKFVYFYLKSDFAQKFLNNSANWATQKWIYLKDLKQIIIPLPPLSEQQKIVEYLDNIFAENQKLKNLYQAQIKNLDEMKQSFLKKAFAGELV